MKKFMGVTLGVIFLAACAGPQKTEKKISATERARMIIEIGNGALLAGDSTDALIEFSRAERLDPKLPELHHSKALAYFAKNDLQEALKSAEKAVELMPTYSDANSTLGKVLLDLKQYQKAEKYLLKAANDPTYVSAHRARMNLGILYYRQGEYKTSERQLRVSLRDAPHQSCVAYYYLGHIELRRKHWDRAIRNYQQSTQKYCGKFSDAHYALGVAYVKAKQYDLARKKFLEISEAFAGTAIAEKALKKLRYLP